jgi:hypothetical protein
MKTNEQFIKRMDILRKEMRSSEIISKKVINLLVRRSNEVCDDVTTYEEEAFCNKEVEADYANKILASIRRMQNRECGKQLNEQHKEILRQQDCKVIFVNLFYNFGFHHPVYMFISKQADSYFEAVLVKGCIEVIC